MKYSIRIIQRMSLILAALLSTMTSLGLSNRFEELTPTAHAAATRIWNGGNGEWSTPNNWSGGVAPGPSDTAIINSGTVDVTSDVTVSVLNFNRGVIQGSGTLTVTNTMNWTAGQMGPAGKTVIPQGATLNIRGADNQILKNRTLNNAGTITHTATGVFYGCDAVLNNSGTMDFADGTRFLIYCGAATLNNTGTVSKTTGAGSAEIEVNLNSSGTVSIQSGTLSFTGNSSHNGAVNLASGTTLSFGFFSTYNFHTGSSVNGEGNVIFGNNSVPGGNMNGTYNVTGTTTVNGNINFNTDTSIPTVNLNTNRLAGTGTLTVTSLMNWTGGTMGEESGALSGTTVIAPGATLNASGRNGVALKNRTLDNSGTFNNTVTGNFHACDAVLTNSGTMDVADGTNFIGCGTGTLNNTGALTKSTGSGSATIGARFNNRGTVSIETGTLNCPETFTQNAGKTVIGDDGILKLGNTPFALNGGELSGRGVVDGDVLNEGTVSPGLAPNSAGTLTIKGSYTQTSTGRLKIEIGGAADTQVDRLITNTSPNTSTNFGGSLDLIVLPTFQPGCHDAFIVSRYGTRTGEFSNRGGFDLGGGRLLFPNYQANELHIIPDSTGANADTDSCVDAWDNCPEMANENQEDLDQDRIGDVCDDDADGDDVRKPDDFDDLNRLVCRDADSDTCDDCSKGLGSNPADDGADWPDRDGLCNLGDPDDDNDGVNDSDDSAPLDPRRCQDVDADTCDECSSGAISIPANDGPDRDNDGRCDRGDNCPDDPNPDQANNDGGSAGDICDADDDNDGQIDTLEIKCGSAPLDASSRSPDLDGDTDPDCNDPDDDGDNRLDEMDNCPLNRNTEQEDNDRDRLGDVCDPDDDNDGILDDSDTDDDNDDVPDAEDAFPSNRAEWLDTDHDHLGNNADTDDDNDGLRDAVDNCPRIRNTEQEDADGDLIGNACDPILNPNIHVTFGSNRDGNFEIYVMTASGRRIVRLTNSPGDDVEPVLSPDRTKIAFTSVRDGNYEIYTMNLDGACVKRLTNSTSVDRNPAWSPDGKKIVFTSTRDGNSKIYSLDVVDCTNPTTPTATLLNNQVGIEPAWSPDGSRIAFTGPGWGRYAVLSMNTDGSNLRPLTSGQEYNFHPTWSPDGSTIAFIRLAGPTNRLYVMNRDGTDVRPLFERMPVSEPAWGANNKIVFRSTIGQEIYRVNSDGTGLTRMTNHPAFDGWPHW